MNRQWLLAKRSCFVRDLVRDYCRVHEAVRAQQNRFAVDGTVSWAALQDLLGEATRKGVFWQLKDTAHHLFGTWLDAGQPGQEKAGIVEALLDWCIGYAFHECLKLREDAYQGRQYANRLLELEKLPGVEAGLLAKLKALTGQTAESSRRELSRILRVLDYGLGLLADYLQGEKANTSLARWLASQSGLAAESFGSRWPTLLASLYGEPPLPLYQLAAEDYARSGRLEEAKAMQARAIQADAVVSCPA